ncbi:hypothetical protein PMI14_03038 [Acidovorax sp. CF316]|uniref:hypothetical protein n=1 Tax=Acidovorax sp. CF316 TaxID=1144317 RepID=UPI00026BCB51|nr:hypothetical protein [Acidovorax sp. CF316]EJE52235.1 hypothetical protein PMI14_03038 [Acidovorax sp. CF316]
MPHVARDTSLGPQPGTSTGDAIDQLGPEVAAVLREGRALERRGSLDSEATARIEARLQAIIEAQDRAMQAQKAFSEEADDPPLPVGARAQAYVHWAQVRSVARWMVPLLLLVLAMAGIVLGMTLGQGFIWLGRDAYEPVGLGLFVALLPVLAVVFYKNERTTHSLRSQYPTWLVRWLFMYPTLVVFSAALVATTPWGWSVALGWIVGTPSRAEVRLVSIGHFSRNSKACDQSAEVEFKGMRSSICLEGRAQGVLPDPGERVAVSGHLSRLGLYVERIHGR